MGVTFLDEEVRNAILKVALGCSVEQVPEEYAVTHGQLTLDRRRETRKDIPPDLKAARLLMEGQDFAGMSDRELEAEKQRLLARLKEEKDEG